MDFASIDLVEKLHEDKGVEDNGVVLRGRGVKRSITTTVNVEHSFAWRAQKKGRNKRTFRLGLSSKIIDRFRLGLAWPINSGCYHAAKKQF